MLVIKTGHYTFNFLKFERFKKGNQDTLVRKL